MLNSARPIRAEGVAPMLKFVIVLALSGTICACAAQQAATAEPAKPASSAEAVTRVCEDIEEESTGTRLGTDRVCKLPKGMGLPPL